MRKLKLQMQFTIDGFVAGPNGEMDWMIFNWDDQLKNYISEITAPVDTILMGRKLAEGFIPHWKAALEQAVTADDFTQKMVTTPKVVFSKSLREAQWDNTLLIGSDMAKEVKNLKAQDGGDMIAYGGAHFVSNLIKAGLIDEYHLFINPAAIGSGMAVFKNLKQRLDLKLADSKTFGCGIVLLVYKPV